MKPIKTLLHIALTLAALAVAALPTEAQETTVSVLTARPGAEVYQLEGHTGLRINSPLTGDITVNWGVFDFNSPNFIYRFVKGETDYLCAAWPTQLFLEEYRREGREVAEQQLVLTPEETNRVIELVSRNLLPENRVYRYNYVRDNCATRPLDIIERALGDTLRFGGATPSAASSGKTFREVMTTFHANYPWYQFGIDTALGSGIDSPLGERDYAFAPELLHDMLATAVRPDGSPVVDTERILVEAPASGTAVLPPPPFMLRPMTWACIVMIVSAACALPALRKRRLTRALRIASGIYFAVAGIEGLVLTFLIFISVHEATSPNWLYLWLNPLCLIPAIAVWIKKAKRLVVYYQIVNFALLIGLLAVSLCGVQRLNPAFLPLIAADLLLSGALASVLTARKNPDNDK